MCVSTDHRHGARTTHKGTQRTLMATRNFPDGFLWGAATSGHQTEGDNDNSDTWFLEQQSRRSSASRPARRATRGNYGSEDFAWSPARPQRLPLLDRVGPGRAAPGRVRRRALSHYGASSTAAASWAPAVVTFTHFTAPHWFAMRGGWLEPDAPDASPGTAPGDGGLRRPHRLRRHAQRAEPGHKCSTRLDSPTSSATSSGRRWWRQSATGVERYRAGNVVLPEEFSPMQASLTAAHLQPRQRSSHTVTTSRSA